MYVSHYKSPIGNILLSADDEGITGLWFENQKYYAEGIGKDFVETKTDILLEAEKWLDIYFKGKEPDFFPKLHFIGTDFRKAVWEELVKIPYEKTVTYGFLAEKISKKQGVSHMSAQAVGGAVGHNKISVMVPCHRVVGADGSLTGYAGGIDKKIFLLKLEKADTENLFIPKK